MKELMNKTTMFFDERTSRSDILTKDDKNCVFSKKKFIIKNLYEKRELFRETIANFDYVDHFYFVIKNLSPIYDYVNHKNTGLVSAHLKTSIYLNNYVFFKTLMSKFGKEEEKPVVASEPFKDLFEMIETYPQKDFQIDKVMFEISEFSVGIEWSNIEEEEKLDAYYIMKDVTTNDDYTFARKNMFNIVFENKEYDIPTPDKPKKIYVPLNIKNTSSFFKRYKKSFIKNDIEFYDKYKLILDD